MAALIGFGGLCRSSDKFLAHFGVALIWARLDYSADEVSRPEIPRCLYQIATGNSAVIQTIVLVTNLSICCRSERLIG